MIIVKSPIAVDTQATKIFDVKGVDLMPIVSKGKNWNRQLVVSDGVGDYCNGMGLVSLHNRLRLNVLVGLLSSIGFSTMDAIQYGRPSS